MAIVGEAHIVVRAITLGFQKDVEDALKNVNGTVRQSGDKIGKDFSSSFRKGIKSGGNDPFKDFVKSADKARLRFNSLVKTGYTLGPAISGAVSSISDLVFGLFSVAAGAGAAAPALAVLPALLSAIGQAGAVAKLAFMGVGKAISALTKQQTGRGGAKTDNTKQIADARKALARAYQNAADQMAAADRRVADAQVALNKAYEKGAESLQQLGFDAEDAALAQDKAALELEKAKETLARVQDLPADSRARREAELAFKEADLNYRQAVDKANDLKKAQDYAAKTGIEGTQEVIDAKKELTDAEAERAKTERDNAQSIADAQQNVAEALKGTKGAASAAANAMAGLPQSAQDFVKYIASIKPEFDKLRAAAADGLFPKLTIAIQNLVDNLFPMLIPIIRNTASAIGDVAVNFSNMLTTPENKAIIDRVFGGANIKIIHNLGDAFVSVADSALSILDAISPLAVQFSGWIKDVTAGWAETLKLKDANGELAGVFQKAADAAKTIFDALKSTWGALKEFGKAAAPAGLALIQAFGGAMDKMKAFGEAGNKTGDLPKKFMDIAANVQSMGHFLGQVVAALFDLAGNPGVKKFWDTLSNNNVAGIFSTIAQNLTGAGPLLATFITNIANLISKFTETGGLTNFFNILNKAVEVVTAIFSNDLVMKAFTFLAALHGISMAFSVIGSVGEDAFKVISGKLMVLPNMLRGTGEGFMNLGIIIEKFKGGGGLLKSSLGELTSGFELLAGAIGIGVGPLLAIIAAVAALVAIFVLMYQNSEILRESISTLTDAIAGALGDAFATINQAIQDVMPNVTGLQDLFKKMGDFVGTYIVPVLQFVFVGAIHAIAEAIALVIHIAKDMFTAFTDPVKGVKDLLHDLATFFKNTLTNIFNDAKDALGKIPLFDGVAKSAKSAFNGLAHAWNNTIGKFHITIPSWVPTYGGKTWDMPNIPELAQGGVIQATPGGTLARIGEAGRAERVEPLDSQGLSRRDRALISFIIEEITHKNGFSHSGGPIINISPSQGMDEVELAYLVSRKLAWNLRRGA